MIRQKNEKYIRIKSKCEKSNKNDDQMNRITNDYTTFDWQNKSLT